MIAVQPLGKGGVNTAVLPEKSREDPGIFVAAAGEEEPVVEVYLKPGHAAAEGGGDPPLRPGNAAYLGIPAGNGELRQGVISVGVDPDGDVLAVSGAGVEGGVSLPADPQQAVAPLHPGHKAENQGEDAEDDRHGGQQGQQDLLQHSGAPCNVVVSVHNEILLFSGLRPVSCWYGLWLVGACPKTGGGMYLPGGKSRVREPR